MRSGPDPVELCRRTMVRIFKAKALTGSRAETMKDPRFTYDDRVRVRVRSTAQIPSRTGALAWIVGVHAEPREGSYFLEFPTGVVYSIEFEDGDSIGLHEDDLEYDERQSDDWPPCSV